MLNVSDEERATLKALFAEAHGDTLFDPAVADPRLAEVYAPGRAFAADPIEPAAWNTAWAADRLSRVPDLAIAVRAHTGQGRAPLGTYDFVGIPFIHWRPADHPPRV